MGNICGTQNDGQQITQPPIDMKTQNSFREEENRQHTIFKSNLKSLDIKILKTKSRIEEFQFLIEDYMKRIQAEQHRVDDKKQFYLNDLRFKTYTELYEETYEYMSKIQQLTNDKIEEQLKVKQQLDSSQDTEYLKDFLIKEKNYIQDIEKQICNIDEQYHYIYDLFTQINEDQFDIFKDFNDIQQQLQYELPKTKPILDEIEQQMNDFKFLLEAVVRNKDYENIYVKQQQDFYDELLELLNESKLIIIQTDKTLFDQEEQKFEINQMSKGQQQNQIIKNWIIVKMQTKMFMKSQQNLNKLDEYLKQKRRQCKDFNVYQNIQEKYKKIDQLKQKYTNVQSCLNDLEIEQEKKYQTLMDIAVVLFDNLSKVTKKIKDQSKLQDIEQFEQSLRQLYQGMGNLNLEQEQIPKLIPFIQHINKIEKGLSLIENDYELFEKKNLQNFAFLKTIQIEHKNMKLRSLANKIEKKNQTSLRIIQQILTNINIEQQQYHQINQLELEIQELKNNFISQIREEIVNIQRKYEHIKIKSLLIPYISNEEAEQKIIENQIQKLPSQVLLMNQITNQDVDDLEEINQKLKSLKQQLQTYLEQSKNLKQKCINYQKQYNPNESKINNESFKNFNLQVDLLDQLIYDIINDKHIQIQIQKLGQNLYKLGNQQQFRAQIFNGEAMIKTKVGYVKFEFFILNQDQYDINFQDSQDSPFVDSFNQSQNQSNLTDREQAQMQRVKKTNTNRTRQMYKKEQSNMSSSDKQLNIQQIQKTDEKVEIMMKKRTIR